LVGWAYWHLMPRSAKQTTDIDSERISTEGRKKTTSIEHRASS
jgi:hypothetical protein